MKRLSITLTDSQAAALERISAETGATKQSMIGLAISAWIRLNDHLPTSPEGAPEAETVCEVCGAPAEWASYGADNREHYYCDGHDQTSTTPPWFGWCRTWTESEGTRDRERRGFDSQHDAIMHAKAVAAEYKAMGYKTARPMWEQRRECASLPHDD